MSNDSNGFLHGFIDLLFEEKEGLVIVDYKTDSVDAKETQEAVERYRLQGRRLCLRHRQSHGQTSQGSAVPVSETPAGRNLA